MLINLNDLKKFELFFNYLSVSNNDAARKLFGGHIPLKGIYSELHNATQHLKEDDNALIRAYKQHPHPDLKKELDALVVSYNNATEILHEFAKQFDALYSLDSRTTLDKPWLEKFKLIEKEIHWIINYSHTFRKLWNHVKDNELSYVHMVDKFLADVPE